MRRVQIKNFQSLADVELELGRFTVLVGPSSTGKSAVLRALRLVFRNARGTGYIRTGSTGTEVTISSDDPMWSVGVSRGTPGRSNNYVLQNNSEPAEFAKCGTTVPEPVAVFLNVGDESLSTQHDAPFLLSATGSEVAQLFGSLTGADVLQKAAVSGNASARQAKQDIAVATAAIEQATEGLAQLPDVDALERSVSAAEKLMRAAEAAASLRTLCETLERAQARAQGEPKPDVPSLSVVEQLQAHRSALQALIRNAERAAESQFLAAGQVEESQRFWSDSKADLEALFSEAELCERCPLRV